jgi:hypothetical protein
MPVLQGDVVQDAFGDPAHLLTIQPAQVEDTLGQATQVADAKLAEPHGEMQKTLIAGIAEESAGWLIQGLEALEAFLQFQPVPDPVVAVGEVVEGDLAGRCQGG